MNFRNDVRLYIQQETKKMFNLFLNFFTILSIRTVSYLISLYNAWINGGVLIGVYVLKSKRLLLNKFLYLSLRLSILGRDKVSMYHIYIRCAMSINQHEQEGVNSSILNNLMYKLIFHFTYYSITLHSFNSTPCISCMIFIFIM